MPRHTLFAYVEGSDLDGIAEGVESEFTRFVAQTKWIWGNPWVVSQRRDDDPNLQPGDLPDWEVGLNMHLPDPGHEPAGWFADVEQIARFLGRLHTLTGRSFVVGIGDYDRGYSEDLFTIDNPQPDLRLLRQSIGTTDLGAEPQTYKTDSP